MAMVYVHTDVRLPKYTCVVVVVLCCLETEFDRQSHEKGVGVSWGVGNVS